MGYFIKSSETGPVCPICEKLIPVGADVPGEDLYDTFCPHCKCAVTVTVSVERTVIWNTISKG